MDAFVVHGGRRLEGEVRVSGAKNSALKLLAAALLAEGTSRIANVPEIADVHNMTAMLEHVGARVTPYGGMGQAVEVPGDLGQETSAELAARLRASLVLLGPLVARTGRARLAQPGGCNLGNRSIDMHLSGLTSMGADIQLGPDWIEVRADRLVGTEIDLEYASVGATENLLLAAVLAEGTTVIRNAAQEPEIDDLAIFLQKMGADVYRATSDEIVIHGVDALRPVDHWVIGDRIEAGTFAVAAAVTHGRVEVRGVDPAFLQLPLDKLAAAGVGVEVDERSDGFAIDAAGELVATDVVTLPFPGCPTDMQALFVMLLTQAHGTSMVTENVYDDRFGIVPPLRTMGAEIELTGHHAIIRGPRRLRGAQVQATDLRAGAALVVAGLAARGTTVVTEPRHIDRGYADFAGRLCALGANVERTGTHAVAV
jgi:UDP-N-acetylglucosamine 1-carboxyvinyltransferase